MLKIQKYMNTAFFDQKTISFELAGNPVNTNFWK